MTQDYQELLAPLTLKNGATISNRLAMAPTSVTDGEKSGAISEANLVFFEKRSQAAGLIIAGAATTTERGKAFTHQFSAAEERFVPGLTELAKTIKKDGNKAILQIYHAGRQAEASYELYGEAVAPSSVDFPFLAYQPRALTEEEIVTIIKEFGQATSRAIAAGFDGVEIHGANHFLIQQFFSSYSNRRNDRWGGSLEKRMAFPLAVVEEVKRVVAEEAKSDFIVGYRFVPEEIHGENVGYTFEETLTLVDKLADYRLDYLHISIFTQYDAKPEGQTQSYGQAVKEVVGDRSAVMIVSNVFSAAAALDALNHGDIVAIGRGTMIEPKFAQKIIEGRPEEIVSTITNQTGEELGLPPELIAWFLAEGSQLPPLPGVEHLRTSK